MAIMLNILEATLPPICLTAAVFGIPAHNDAAQREITDRKRTRARQIHATPRLTPPARDGAPDEDDFSTPQPQQEVTHEPDRADSDV